MLSINPLNMEPVFFTSLVMLVSLYVIIVVFTHVFQQEKRCVIRRENLPSTKRLDEAFKKEHHITDFAFRIVRASCPGQVGISTVNKAAFVHTMVKRIGSNENISRQDQRLLGAMLIEESIGVRIEKDTLELVFNKKTPKMPSKRMLVIDHIPFEHNFNNPLPDLAIDVSTDVRGQKDALFVTVGGAVINKIREGLYIDSYV